MKGENACNVTISGHNDEAQGGRGAYRCICHLEGFVELDVAVQRKAENDNTRDIDS